jgi:hypothetical protein
VQRWSCWARRLGGQRDGTGTINQAGLDGSNTHAIVQHACHRQRAGHPGRRGRGQQPHLLANGVVNTGTINKANLTSPA